ncbi:heat-shock protein Hsp20 [Flavipsychrobacter stenotrophus]|uniref:Heat-shock protein Hsp20 n=1 Tax=Flavipsychrobacter stenotrophus TaxID=2077091 RepID=A0A2S7T0C1_9BACT|nr:Hsp20/alpha crystallin family protein [Flavipsychrobacter stenotrophus]PQJ12653.1 heat-shock protein Hsp20 [Flavipsychrobacter stenotrophus]
MYQKRSYGMMPATFGGLLENMLHNGISRINEDATAGSTPVNIHETDKGYDLHVVAPGIRKEDFKINVDKNVLTVSYEHKEETKEEGKEENQVKFLRTEYSVKSFKRSFTLNEKIDTTAISAKYSDGILNVSLPKKENAEVPAKEIVIN